MKVALALVLARWPAFGHIELIHVVRATLIKPRNAVSLNPRRMRDEPLARKRKPGRRKGGDDILRERTRQIGKALPALTQSRRVVSLIVSRISPRVSSFRIACRIRTKLYKTSFAISICCRSTIRLAHSFFTG